MLSRAFSKTYITLAVFLLAGCKDGKPIASLILQLTNSATISGVQDGVTDTTVDTWLGGTLNPIVSWQAASGAATYDVTIKDSAGSITICATQNTASTSFSFNNAANCGSSIVTATTYRVYVDAKNSIGTVIYSYTYFPFTVDTAAPSLNCSAINGGAWTNVNTQDLTTGYSCSDGAGSGCNLSTLQCDYNNGSGWSGYSSTCNQTWSDSTIVGGGTFRLQARDTAGNLGASGICAVKIDTVAPGNVIAMTVPAGNIVQSSTTTNWTWTAPADALSGINTTQYQYRIYSDSGCGTAVTGFLNSGTSTSYIAGADGTYYIGVQAQDNAGNFSPTLFCSGSIPRSVQVDTVAPTVTCTSVGGWQTSSTYDIGQAGVTYTCADGGSGCNVGTLQCRYSANNGGAWSGWGSCTAVKADRVSTGLFEVRMTDNAATMGTSSSCTIDIDSTAPAAVSTTFLTPNGVVDTFLNSGFVDFNWSASTDTGSGVASYDYELHSGAGCASLVTSGNIGTNSVTIGGQADGGYSLKVRAINGAGLQSGWACSSRRTVKDMVAPSFTVGVALSGTPTVDIGSSQNISWTASADSYAAGAVLLEYSDDSGGAWTTIGNYNFNASPLAWTVAGIPTTGTSLIRATVTDQAGNVGTASTSGLFNKASGPINFKITGTTNITGATCQLYTLHSQNNLSADTNVSVNTTATMALPAHGHIFSDNACTNLITTVTIATGTSTKNFYFFDGFNESSNLIASGPLNMETFPINISAPSVYGNSMDGMASPAGSMALMDQNTGMIGRTFAYSDRLWSLNTGNGKDLSLYSTFTDGSDFRVSDEIMWHVVQEGSPGSCASDSSLTPGMYGFAYIVATNGAGGTITIDRPFTATYANYLNANISGVAAPNTGSSFCTIQIIRVPNLSGANFGNYSFSYNYYSESRAGSGYGGVFVMRINGGLNTNGSTIDMQGTGFYRSLANDYRQGMGFSGIGALTTTTNNNNGGSGALSGSYGGGGGGGNVGRGYSPASGGFTSYSPGCGGASCTWGSYLNFGGAGGSGWHDSGDSGGIIYMAVKQFVGTGTINLNVSGMNGQGTSAGTSGGGGGAGVIYLQMNNVVAGSVINAYANGGWGGTTDGGPRDGGGGGGGFIQANYCTLSGAQNLYVNKGYGGAGFVPAYDGAAGNFSTGTGVCPL